MKLEYMSSHYYSKSSEENEQTSPYLFIHREMSYSFETVEDSFETLEKSLIGERKVLV
jgi:hypothetical protein